MALPQITIERPRFRFWQSLVLRLWPSWVAAVACIVFGIAAHRTGLVYGALVALGLIIVVTVTAAPLMLGAIARIQRKAIRSLPAGTLFAGPARSRSAWQRGLFILDGTGVQFRFSAVTSSPGDTVLTWPQIVRIYVRPNRSPVNARVDVVTTDGKTVTWSVDGMDDLSAALDLLRLDQGRNTNPAA
jgi:hypothetical protein